ncbi:uncharacterized protein MONOS_10294 [Monocercomonoides exilis]|uniref:uncharacterized protein n=1 Tax=Monocercomonoides exilis TaxID=2049356 RepID=UPI0035599374|nr:hypothetical protein MONOS_10294 [Monocercomonoides exilis]|eukprot:MONOS_10294.1-p1 / transcript=MONOS_10294.1 / gene=MONOS_10294 / organism=Monocercomonoides_exilis_PA203 / gene_product=unspecified product / transcript_product=unspecified product / location=Mono_scaffold00461:44257-45155(-) / protein_length=164 / sequence_SO=supercontig / SO=protein_coding / is_pseudo=false
MEHRYEECGSALRYDTVERTLAVEKPQGGAGEHAITSPGKERLFIHRHSLMNQMQCPMDTCGSCRANPYIEHVSSTAIDQWINATALPKNVEVLLEKDVDVGEKDAGIGKSTKIGLEEAQISSSSTKKYVVEVKMLIGRRKERGGHSKRYDEEGEEGRASEGV